MFGTEMSNQTNYSATLSFNDYANIQNTFFETDVNIRFKIGM